MQAKKIGAIALAGTAFGTVVTPAMVPVMAGAQTSGVSAAADDPSACTNRAGEPITCPTVVEYLLMSLVASLLNGLVTMEAP